MASQVASQFGSWAPATTTKKEDPNDANDVEPVFNADGDSEGAGAANGSEHATANGSEHVTMDMPDENDHIEVKFVDHRGMEDCWEDFVEDPGV